MNYTNTIIELLLFALGLSLWINSLHLAFGEGMVLNWLYEWLESKFRNNENKRVCDLDYVLIGCENDICVYWNKELSIYKRVSESKEVNYVNDNNIIKPNLIPIKSKYRNSEGLLYIAKPIYACASCMPSIHSLPLLLIFPLWKVFFICIFASVISTLIRDQLYND